MENDCNINESSQNDTGYRRLNSQKMKYESSRSNADGSLRNSSKSIGMSDQSGSVNTERSPTGKTRNYPGQSGFISMSGKNTKNMSRNQTKNNRIEKGKRPRTTSKRRKEYKQPEYFNAELITAEILMRLVDRVYEETEEKYLKKIQPEFAAEYTTYCCECIMSMCYTNIETKDNIFNEFSDNQPYEPTRLKTDNWFRKTITVNKRESSFNFKKKSVSELSIKDDGAKKNTFVPLGGIMNILKKKEDSDSMKFGTDRDIGSGGNIEKMTNFLTTGENFRPNAAKVWDEKIQSVVVDISNISDEDELARTQNFMRNFKENKDDQNKAALKEQQGKLQKNQWQQKGKLKGINYTYDYEGKQIFFDRPRPELLNNLIVDARTLVLDPKDKDKKTMGKGMFIGRKKKDGKNSKVDELLPKIENYEKQNAQLQSAALNEPKRQMEMMILQAGVKMSTNNFVIEKTNEQQIRTESGKLRCTKQYFEKVQKKGAGRAHGDLEEAGELKDSTSVAIKLNESIASMDVNNPIKDLKNLKIKIDDEEKFKEFLRESQNPSPNRYSKRNKSLGNVAEKRKQYRGVTFEEADRQDGVREEYKDLNLHNFHGTHFIGKAQPAINKQKLSPLDIVNRKSNEKSYKFLRLGQNDHLTKNNARRGYLTGLGDNENNVVRQNANMREENKKLFSTFVCEIRPRNNKNRMFTKRLNRTFNARDKYEDLKNAHSFV